MSATIIKFPRAYRQRPPTRFTAQINFAWLRAISRTWRQGWKWVDVNLESSYPAPVRSSRAENLSQVGFPDFWDDG